MTKTDVYGDLKNKSALMCNCANCGKDLLAMKYGPQVTEIKSRGKGQNLPQVCRGRLRDRPYCETCYYHARGIYG